MAALTRKAIRQRRFEFMQGSELYLHLLPIVNNGFANIFRYQQNIELSLRHRFRLGTRVGLDGESLSTLVPSDPRPCRTVLHIIQALSIVFVQQKLTVSSRIYL